MPEQEGRRQIPKTHAGSKPCKCATINLEGGGKVLLPLRHHGGKDGLRPLVHERPLLGDAVRQQLQVLPLPALHHNALAAQRPDHVLERKQRPALGLQRGGRRPRRRIGQLL